MKIENLFLPGVVVVLVLSTLAVFAVAAPLDLPGSPRERGVLGAEVAANASVDASVNTNAEARKELREAGREARGEMREVRVKVRDLSKELQAAKRNLTEAWRDLKDARQMSKDERNIRLLRAIDAFAESRIAAAARFEERGVSASVVAEYDANVTALQARAVNASFEERKIIFRELHREWKAFVAKVVKTLVLEKVKRHVGTLNATLVRIDQAITSLESNGTNASIITSLRLRYDGAVNATAEIESATTLRETVYKFFVARSKIHQLVKMISRVRNSLSQEVEAEEVSEAISDNLPDVQLNVTSSTTS